MKKSKFVLVGVTLKYKVQAILGWSLAIFGALGSLVELTSGELDPFGIVLFLVFLACGGAFLSLSFRNKKLVSQFRLYVSILSNQSSMSIYDLSRTVGIPEVKVKKDLQTMIDRRFFADAYIDHGRKCLVFPLMEQETRRASDESHDVLYVTAVCPICGGSNRIVSGKNNRCMYCDNIIRK